MSECSKCGPEAAAEALGVESAEDNGQYQINIPYLNFFFLFISFHTI